MKTMERKKMLQNKKTDRLLAALAGLQQSLSLKSCATFECFLDL